ncbi:hypothetical protein [Streptomyces scabiei]|uniref:hypothetical protein n=1 Tax=Streptomyces scabiei TaxID=1930 RepID=UPI00073F9A6C|nr:hypothetical protein [Streptomyces scabiei]
MLLRLTYLAVTNAFAMLHLLPMSDHGKDIEILVLRRQLMVWVVRHGYRHLGPDPAALPSPASTLPS